MTQQAREKEKKRLVELLKTVPTTMGGLIDMETVAQYADEIIDVEQIADYLLSNGNVIVPPCKVGDSVWLVGFSDKEIIDGYVEEISYKWVCQQEAVLVSIRMNTKRGWLTYWRDFSAFGDHVFLSKAEAEQALKERETK